jgi:hypothetical protein
MRVEFPAGKFTDHFGDAFAFLRHGFRLERRSRGDETHSEKEIKDFSSSPTALLEVQSRL